MTVDSCWVHTATCRPSTSNHFQNCNFIFSIGGGYTEGALSFALTREPPSPLRKRSRVGPTNPVLIITPRACESSSSLLVDRVSFLLAPFLPTTVSLHRHPRSVATSPPPAPPTSRPRDPSPPFLTTSSICPPQPTPPSPASAAPQPPDPPPRSSPLMDPPPPSSTPSVPHHPHPRCQPWLNRPPPPPRWMALPLPAVPPTTHDHRRSGSRPRTSL
jgi:hypothetical protein